MSNTTPATLDESRMQRWRQLKEELALLPASDAAGLCDTVAGLMIDWSSNPAAMREVLTTGVACGELNPYVLQLWEARCGADATESASSDSSIPEPALSPLVWSEHGLVGEQLHPALRPLAAALLKGHARAGRDALAIGQKLVQARVICEQHGLNFEFFLQQLERTLGLHRASGYLFMKFAEFDFPAGLGTAVMKWIAQGFPKGSAARLIARQALAERMTLPQLEARFGGLRATRTGRMGVAQRDLARHVAHNPRGQELMQKKEALLAQQQALETELQAIEQELLQMALSADSVLSSGPAKLRNS